MAAYDFSPCEIASKYQSCYTCQDLRTKKDEQNLLALGLNC